MLLVGSDDGVYRIDAFDDSDAATDATEATRLLDGGRTMRLRQFDGLDGVFAATTEGLFHSSTGQQWTDCNVPDGTVYAVGASNDGERLYVGTRPAAIYATDAVTAVTTASGEGVVADDADWRECDGFQDLPSRDEWRLPRHENLAQVRDVTADPAEADRIVAGVEVGGVHLSEDGGDTWQERADGVHDDVHELCVVGPDRYVAATGFGLYRTHDAGHSWTRLDGDVPQRYFRSAFALDGTVYTGANMANSSTWDDDDADPGCYRVHDDGRLEPLAIPDEAGTVTGMGAADGDLVLATHRGHVFVQREGELSEVGRFPTPADTTGRYTPVTWLSA